jgi:hypothetical protein
MRLFQLQKMVLAAAISLPLALCAVFLLSGITLTAHGQATTEAGAIQGTVTDPTGAAVPGAKIVITNLGTGAERSMTTTNVGLYSAEALQPGTYTVHVVSPGFSAAVLTLTVQVGQTANGSIKLRVQGATAVVQVEAAAVQVDTSSSSVQGVLNRQDIDNLPLNGRNFLDMAQLQPGVQIQDGTSFDPTKNGFSSISFGGRYGRTARITMDGIDISDENVGTTTQNISEEAIQEFQIAESSLDISTSLTSSGSVNIVTRSGSNVFHGDGFYNFRDQRAGDAEPTGYTVIPGVDSDYMQRNNMGGSLGGPIMPNKLFFFGEYEYFRQNAFNPVIFGGPLAALNGGYPVKFREQEPLGRLDWNAPHNIKVFARWNYDLNSDVAAFGGSNYSPFLNRDNTRGFGGGVDYASTHFTHSFRAGYFKFTNHMADATGGGLYNPAPGINLVIDPYNYSSGANLLVPQATVQSNKQIKYDGAWVKGSHSLRYGIGFDILRGGGFASFFGIQPQVFVNATAAVLAQANAGPFSGGDANPLNYPTGAGGINTVTFGNGEGFFTEKPSFGFPGGGQSDNRFNGYISDTWKLRKLSVNYGLRYVRDTGRDDEDLAPIPILDTLLPGLGNTPDEPNMSFGPQAGFAYDLHGNGKTVIRVGGGLYYENMVWNNVLFDRPPKLTEGLFFGTEAFCPTNPAGQNFCGQPVGDVYKTIAADETAYQAATKAAGPAANGEYLGTALAVPASESLTLFSPNYKTPNSWQMNVGVQREIHPGMVLSVDYVRSVGEHFVVAQDVNHVGDAQYLNVANAQAAIAATVSACDAYTLNEAIHYCPGLYPDGGGATITDFAANGLDSENVTGEGFPGAGAAFAGMNTTWGQVMVAYPSGRSVYNGLDVMFTGQVRHVVTGLNNLNMTASYSYSHYDATGTTSLGDADFIGNAFDNNNPTSYFGPTSLDRHHMFSIGLIGTTFGGVDFDTVAHLYSSLPTTMFLPTVGSADIFTSDWTGSGAMGDEPSNQGALVPGTNMGAFGRKYNGASINRLISSYNKTYAGKLTPQGQALVNANLLTSAQMTELGAVMEPLTLAPANQVSNDILRTWDITIGRDIKVVKERITVRPTFAAFNILNAANYNNRTGTNGQNVMWGQLNGLDDSPNGTAGHISEQALRVSTGSGVYAEGSPRQIEYGLKISF